MEEQDFTGLISGILEDIEFVSEDWSQEELERFIRELIEELGELS